MRRLLESENNDALQGLLFHLHERNIEIHLENEAALWTVWVLDDDRFDEAEQLLKLPISGKRPPIIPKAPSTPKRRRTITLPYALSSILVFFFVGLSAGQTFTRMGSYQLDFSTFAFTYEWLPPMLAWWITAFFLHLFNTLVTSNILSMIFGGFALYLLCNEVEQIEGPFKLLKLFLLHLVVFPTLFLLLSLGGDFSEPPRLAIPAFSLWVDQLICYSLGMSWWSRRRSYQAGQGFLMFFLFFFVLQIFTSPSMLFIQLHLVSIVLGFVMAKASADE